MKVRYLALVLLAGCGSPSNPPSNDNTPSAATTPTLNFSVGSVFKHDTTSYTEGLLFHDHQLFESSGANPDDPETQRSMVGIANMNHE